MIFSGRGAILAVIFPDEGKHADSAPTHRERGRGGSPAAGTDTDTIPGWEAEAELAYEQASDRYSLRADFDEEGLDESIMEKVSSGGVVTPVVYGWNPISSRIRTSVQLRWQHRWQTSKDAPRWESDLALDGNWRGEDSHLVYPYSDRMDLLQTRVRAEVKTRFAAVELRAGLSGAGGWVWEKGLTAQAEVTVEPPYRLQEHWDRVLEYAKAPHAGVNLGVHWFIPQVKGLFLRGDFAAIRAFRIVYLPSPWRFSASIGIGYGF